MTDTEKQVIRQEDLLNHWQGHRNLTRRLIEAFPEKDLFEFTIGGMRPFAQLASEMLAMGGPALKSIVNAVVEPYSEDKATFTTKAQILQEWDKQTKVIHQYFNMLPNERFSETFDLFGEYNFPVIDNILYFIDNEVHHRGQGYVYLRALGIEPPMFWERA